MNVIILLKMPNIQIMSLSKQILFFFDILIKCSIDQYFNRSIVQYKYMITKN